ncbi:MAG: MMPL family transporter [Pseudomonadota bacterium]
MIERIIKFIVENGGKLLLLSGALVLISIPFLLKVRIDASADVWYPSQHDPDRIFLEKTYQDFESGWSIAVIVHHDRIFSPATLAKIQKLTARIEEMPAVDYVLSITNANVVKSSGDEITVSNRSENIPESDEEIEEFKNDILSNPLYARSIVSEDLKTTAISVMFDEVRHPQEAIRETIRAIKKVVADDAGPEKMYIGGPRAMSSTIYDMTVRDLSTYGPMAFAIIVVILFLYFFNVPLVATAVAAVSMAVGFTFAGMAAFKVPLTPLGTIIPIIIATQAMSYFIRLFSEYSRQRACESQPKAAVGQALRHTLAPISLAALTTAIGFYSLSPVDITEVRRFGQWLAMGMLVLFAVVAFFVPPVLTRLFPRPRVGSQSPDEKSLGALGRFAMFFTRHRVVLSLVAGAACVAGALGMSRLNVESNLYLFFRGGTPIRQAIDVIRDNLKGSMPIDVFITGPEKNSIEDPNVLKAMERLETLTDERPYVGTTISIVDYLKLMNRALHADEPAYDVLPDDKGETARYLFAYSVADPQKILDRYIDYDHRIARMSVRTGLVNCSDLIPSARSIERQCRDLMPSNVVCKATGELLLACMASDKLARGILTGFTQAALAIFVIMLVIFRSFKIGIVAMIPNLVPILFVLGFMGFAGIPFNGVTSIMACITIGITVDDTIHFIVRFLRELKKTDHYRIREDANAPRITDEQMRALANTCRHEGRPIVMTAAIVALGFAVLMFSQFVPTAMLGMLLALAMIVGAFCELVILPALLASIRIGKPGSGVNIQHHS